ncbi:hypothetical protein ASF60_13360 [Methylobacterium sp. Leaf113]|nr:hypothetical protein ASF60_13360 [Methylobacterium sp. Leaf113]
MGQLSPPGRYDEPNFEPVAAYWENPDFVDVTLHSYHARWDETEPDPRSAELEAKVKATQTLSTQTVRRQHLWDRLRVFTNGGWLVHRSP